jgi:hypothetical protein
MAVSIIIAYDYGRKKIEQINIFAKQKEILS